MLTSHSGHDVRRRARGVAALALAIPVAMSASAGTAGAVARKGHAKAQKGHIHLALVIEALANPYYVAAEDGAKAAAKKLGVGLSVTGTTDFTPSAFNADIQDEITAGVNGIIYTAGDATSANGVTATARKDGIAVATIVVDAPSSRRQFFVGVNPTVFGETQGQRLVAYLHATHVHGVVEMADVSCGPTIPSQELEHRGVMRAVTKGNRYKKQFRIDEVAYLNGTQEPTTDLATYQTLATAHPNVRVVISQCASGAPNAALAETQHHLHWLIVGDSTLPQTIKDIAKGKVLWTESEEPYETAYTAVRDMILALKGKRKMPHGTHDLPLNVYVRNLAYMTRIHLPGHLQTVAQGFKSPDTVG